MLVSGAVSPRGAVAELIDAWLIERQYVAITSDHILDEVARALARPYFASRIVEPDRSAYVELIRHEAIVVVPRTVVRGVAADPDDDAVLAAAIEGRADYLVTGDAALLAVGALRGVRLVRARELLDLL